MLVLSRKVGERILIGDEISVMVVAIQDNKIRLGIAAPRSVAIHRPEVLERINAKKNATQSPPEASPLERT